MNYNFYPRNVVLCIDMLSFYASIEAVRLGLDPMKVMLAVVGDTSRSGSIVLAASPTLKKKHGISNVSRFYELPDDPDIYIVEANMADYLHTSLKITKLLNKFLAKVVMDLHAKKVSNGIAECRYEDVETMLWPFPVKKIWGIGSRMERNLYRMGITTLGQIAEYPLTSLKKRFGIMGEQLYWH